MATQHFINAIVSRGIVGFFDIGTGREQYLDYRYKVDPWVSVHDGPRRLSHNPL
jgi:hypothetical protein